MANQFDEEMKKFVKTYAQKAKENEERKKEIDVLEKEIEAVVKEDRDREARRLEGIKKASGIDLPPNPISDPRYEVKQRQKQELEAIQEEAEKSLNAELYGMKGNVNQQLTEKEAELKVYESKYLANARKALDIAEQKIQLGGSEEELRIFNSDKDIATKAIAELKKKSDALCEEIDRLKFFAQTLDVMGKGEVDLSKLDKMMGKLKVDTTVRQMNEELKKLTDEKAKEQPTKPEEPQQTDPETPEPTKPEGPQQPSPETPEPARPEGSQQPSPEPKGIITAIKYKALDSTYEVTFENGATKIYDTENGAIREFSKEEKRYLRENIKGIRPGRYKKCDIGLFKMLRSLDKEQGTNNFKEYMKLLNGEDTELQLTYDASQMNDPLAFKNQTKDTRRIMMGVLNRARKLDGVDVVGYKPTRLQRIADFFLGNGTKQIEEAKEARTEMEEHSEEPRRTEVEEHKMDEAQKTEIDPTRVEEHALSPEQAEKLEQAFETEQRKSRRSQKGQNFAQQLHDSAERKDEESEYSVDDIINEVKSHDKDGVER